MSSRPFGQVLFEVARRTSAAATSGFLAKEGYDEKI
jgi:hypothetical protein